MKGILLTVIPNHLGDCTNGGVSKGRKHLVLVGPGVPEEVEATIETPPVVIDEREGRDCSFLGPILRPLVEPSDKTHCNGMYGGNDATSDHPWFVEYTRGRKVLRIHDRVETWEDYNRMR